MINAHWYVVLIAAILVGIGLVLSQQFPTTYDKAHALAVEARNKDQPSGFTDTKDRYSNNFKIERVNNQTEDYISYTARSAGQDGLFGTNDDVTSTVIDINWSKKAGRSAAVMGKEFIKGVIDGSRVESPHTK